MHSSGRGEDSPEAYRGVVLPSGQQQPLPYGEHVQPAGGSPWGSPEGAPEPADATQMLPPYPGGDPLGPLAPQAVPVADATQMLPPYPGGDPNLSQQAGPPQGPVPPLPPVPPQAPHIAEPAPAEATQALPFFQDQQDPQIQHGQQGHPIQPGQPGPQEYGRQPYEQAGGYDQYQAPGSQGYGGQEQYPGAYNGYEEEQPAQPGTGPGHDSDYDHLFRNDVPSPAPIRPHIIQPPSQQNAQQQYAQGPGQPPYGGQPGYGAEPGYDYAGDRGGRRRLSPKAVIGIVVGGCVVAGLVVGALLNSGGGGGGNPGTVADSTTSAPAGTSSANSTAGGSGTDDAVKQQASALDSLLSTSDASRSKVVSAVASIKACNDLPTAADDLNTAAGQRTSLVTQLSKLSVDKLPNHDALTNALTKAWQASSSADSHYAKWAGQAQSHKVCHGGHARSTGETQAGDVQSGTATTEKKKAVKLWNSIAEKYGLTKRQYSQL